MRDKLKSVLGNGLPYGIVFFGFSFILSYKLFGLQKSLQMSAVWGVSALLINGLLYNRFAKPLKDLEGIKIRLLDSELLVIHAPANHLIEDSLVPGKLFLTDRRIIFKALETNENQPLEYSWNLASLMPVAFSGSFWNAGGEIVLKKPDEISLMFEVNELKRWKEVLRNV